MALNLDCCSIDRILINSASERLTVVKIFAIKHIILVAHLPAYSLICKRFIDKGFFVISISGLTQRYIMLKSAMIYNINQVFIKNNDILS
jgi:hypothetical protein